MLRQARIDAPGVLHHIICRGIEQRDIFYDDADRKNERSLFESDLTKWHRTYDAVYRIVAKPSIQSTASL